MKPWPLILLIAACPPEAGSTMAGAETPEGPAAAAAELDDAIFAAFKAEDYAAVEARRASLDVATVERLSRTWKQRLPWPVKNGFAWLFIHRSEPDVLAIMWDALDSPEPKIRAAAVSTLAGDPAVLERLAPGGVPDVAAIEAAVSQVRAPAP